MQVISTRSAHHGDREALCRMYHEFHQFHVRGLPDRLLSLGDPPMSYADSDLYHTLGKIIDVDDAAIFVAETAGQLLGLAEVYGRQEQPHPLRVAYCYGYLQSLLVGKAWRGQGIGARLLEAAQGWAKEQGACEMRLDTWEFAAGPLRFYEKQDYRTLRRTLVREL